VLAGFVVALAVAPAAAQASGTASLTGEVTAVKGATKLVGITVTASGPESASATTVAGGKYTIPNIKGGSYEVTFEDPTEKFASLTTSTTLTEGAPTTLNAALHEGGSISGTVTSAATGAGLGGVLASASGETFESTFTEPNGHYAIKDLPPGHYAVFFSPSSGEYVGQSAEATVTEGGIATVNAALKQAGKISGRVTDAYTHNGLGKINVSAFVQGGGGSGFATTNENGEYTVVGLPSGSYKIEYSWQFSAAETKEFENTRFIPKYLTQFFNGQPTSAAANTVGANEGSTTSGINVAMVPSAPVNTSPPAISGAQAVGSLLTCSTGSWTGESEQKLSMGWPLSSPFGYSWLRDGAAIAGTALAGYVVQSADVGHGLQCEVSATNAAGHASAKSATFTVANPIPVITTSASNLRVSKGLTPVPIKCANAACVGSGQVVATVIVKHRKGKRTVTKKTALLAGSGSYSLAAGKAGTITVHLTKAAKKKLASAHRLSAKLTISVKGGKSVQKTVQLTLAAVSKKKKK
jgi:carboxypeptidase family protein